jgi:hypothetical protein
VPSRPVHAAAWAAEWTHRLLGTSAPLLSRIEVRKIAWTHWFRTDAAARDLGWTAKIPFEEGIARCVPSCREMLAARTALRRLKMRSQPRQVRDARPPREAVETLREGE